MRSILCLTLALGSLVFAGCAAGDVGDGDGDERTDEARQQQVGIGFYDWRRLSFTFADLPGTPLGEMHMVSHTLDLYVPGTEYWYINRDALGLLGRYDLEIRVEDERGTADPPGPDYPDEQQFTQEQYPSGGWGSAWTTDPLSGGTLHDGGGVQLRITTSSGDVSGVAWYQVIPTLDSPQWLTPSGVFEVGSSRVIVPSGYSGYAIDQAVP